MRKKMISVIMGVVLAGVMLVGCGSSEETKTTETEITETQEEGETTETTEKIETAETAETTETAELQKYGIVLKTLSSEFWQTMEKGIKEKAQELGVEVEILAANSEDDVEGQVTVFETMIESGEYNAFAVAPLSDSNLLNTVADANSKGYLVADIDERLNFDLLAANQGSVVSFVTTDNITVGKTAGEYIASLLQEGDEVAIIEGKAGAASGEDRKAGSKEAFEAAGLNIVDSQPADWDKTRAYDLATNLISKHENLKAIYCCNDTMAMGAYQAVVDSGKDIIVVGTDGNSDAVESVKNGGLTATVGQDSAQVGARSLELLVEAYNNGDQPGDKEMIDERINPILITIDQN